MTERQNRIHDLLRRVHHPKEEVTVALHLRSIYRKLGVRNRTQAVRLLLERGWEA